MPISQAEIDHLAGEGVVVRTWYADPENKGQARSIPRCPAAKNLISGKRPLSPTVGRL